MPPMINPQVIGALMAQQGGQPAGAPPPGAAPPPQGAGAIPPTTPVQQPPQQGAGGMMAGMQVPDQSQQQPQGDIKGALAEAVQAISAAREHIGNLEGQISKVPNAPSGYNPQFQPGVRNIPANLGKAALLVGSGTHLGQNVLNTMQRPAQATRAQDIQKIQEQLEATKSSLGATGQEIGGLGMAAKWAQAERGLDIKEHQTDINAQRVAAYSQGIKDRAKNFLATQDWRKAELDERTRNDIVKAAQAQVDEAGRDYRANNRDATEEEVAQVVAGTKKEIANQVAVEHPTLGSWLAGQFGLPTPQNTAPSPEMRPTTAAPNTPAKPVAHKGKAGAPGGVPKGATGIAPGSDGKKHYHDAKGNDLGVAQ